MLDCVCLWLVVPHCASHCVPRTMHLTVHLSPTPLDLSLCTSQPLTVHLTVHLSTSHCAPLTVHLSASHCVSHCCRDEAVANLEEIKRAHQASVAQLALKTAECEQTLKGLDLTGALSHPQSPFMPCSLIYALGHCQSPLAVLHASATLIYPQSFSVHRFTLSVTVLPQIQLT